MNSPHHHPHHHEHHHDVHQQRLLWFFSFCNQRSSGSSSSSSSSCSSSSSSSGGSPTNHNSRSSSSRDRNNKQSRHAARQQQKQAQAASSRNKFAIQYQQQLLKQQKQSSNVFGCDLTQHTSLYSQEDSIPHIVKSCTKFIEKHGIIFGIYRLSGMRVNIHKLRQEFDKNPKNSMIDSEAITNDAHAVACVLKQYFRELPTPLLTFHMYEKFIELFKQSNNHSQQQAITTTIKPTTFTPTTTTTQPHKSTPLDDKMMKQHYSPNQEMQYVDDNAANLNCGSETQSNENNNDTTTQHYCTKTPTTIATKIPLTTKPTLLPMTTKSKSSTQHKITPIGSCKRDDDDDDDKKHVGGKQFASSVSDSQLISLSSVVTTTTTDIKYQVRLEDLRQLLLKLPPAHYETLKFLMRHLACIAANGQKTGMDSKNVAIVWAPNLLKPRELELSAGLETLQIIGLQAVITEQLIKHHEFLFQDGGSNIIGGEQKATTRDQLKEESIERDTAQDNSRTAKEDDAEMKIDASQEDNAEITEDNKEQQAAAASVALVAGKHKAPQQDDNQLDGQQRLEKTSASQKAAANDKALARRVREEQENEENTF